MSDRLEGDRKMGEKKRDKRHLAITSSNQHKNVQFGRLWLFALFGYWLRSALLLFGFYYSRWFSSNSLRAWNECNCADMSFSRMFMTLILRISLQKAKTFFLVIQVFPDQLSSGGRTKTFFWLTFNSELFKSLNLLNVSSSRRSRLSRVLKLNSIDGLWNSNDKSSPLRSLLAIRLLLM